MCTLRFGGSFSLPIDLYLNPFGHPVCDYRVSEIVFINDIEFNDFLLYP